MSRLEDLKKTAAFKGTPAFAFLLNFMAARGLVSAAAFLSQIIVAARLGQTEYVAYAAACALVYLSTEAQTLAGNLEVLAKRHVGIHLAAVLSNRVYFNIILATPTLWLLRKLWAARLGTTGLWFALAAVVLSAFFPGSYGDAKYLRTGLRCEAGVSALCLIFRILLHPSLEVFWLLFCSEIIGRALVGLILAVKARQVRLLPDLNCILGSFRYGMILLFQMAFQRLEIAVLPGIILPKSAAMVWAIGSSILFTLNAVIYQALVGYSVVEARSEQRRQSVRACALCSAALSVLVLIMSSVLALRQSVHQSLSTTALALLATYFFAISFENFTYMRFFFAVQARKMFVLSVSRVCIVGIFAALVASDVDGIWCLLWISVGKLAAAIGEVIFLSKRHRDQRLRSYSLPEEHALTVAQSRIR